MPKRAEMFDHNSAEFHEEILDNPEADDFTVAQTVERLKRTTNLSQEALDMAYGKPKKTSKAAGAECCVYVGDDIVFEGSRQACEDYAEQLRAEDPEADIWVEEKAE